MSIQDKQGGASIPSWIDETKLKGTKISPGTYVGVVKNVLDPSRLGRLQVWIPELGGTEDDWYSWKTVRYASPFLGSTAIDTMGKAPGSEENFSNSSQTYGFWAVPPDVGNQVLCTFTQGDLNRGFWFACVFDRKGHYMIPGNPGGKPGTDFDTAGVGPTLKSVIKKLGADGNLPLSEFNPYNTKEKNTPIVTRKKVLHDFLAQSYIQQGLDRDLVRGPGRSSSQRDMPSTVFGISTPGRPVNDIGIGEATAKQTGDKRTYGRKGGHSFVMDDGDYFGESQGIRLRTAGGHQILMDDTTGTFYFINKTGSAWVELANSGHVHVYSSAGINMRTRGDFNLHSDKKVRIFGNTGLELYTDGKMLLEGKKEVGITGGGGLTLFGYKNLSLLSTAGHIVVDAAGKLTLRAEQAIDQFSAGKLNLQVKSKEPKKPKPPVGITTYDHDDTMEEGVGTWTTRKRAVKSTVAVFPTHEPWNRAGYDAFTGAVQDVGTSRPPTLNYTGGNAGNTGIAAGKDVPAGTPLTADYLASYPGVVTGIQYNLGVEDIPKVGSYSSASAPRANGPIGNLQTSQVESLMASIGYGSSGGDPSKTGADYGVIRPSLEIGRYGVDAEQLERRGYLKAGSTVTYGKEAILRDDVWTDKNSIDGLETFLTSAGEQDAILHKQLEENYTALVNKGAITADSPPNHVAGMLAVSQKLTPNGAVSWARDAQGASASGEPAALLYARGDYMIQQNVTYR